MLKGKENSVDTSGMWQLDGIPGQFAMGYYYGSEKDKVYLNLPYYIYLDGELDVKRLEACIYRLIEEESILHSYLVRKDNDFYIRKGKEQEFHLEMEALTGETRTEKLNNLDRWMKKRACEPLELLSENEYPFIFQLFQLEEKEHILFFMVHHLFSDIASIEIMIDAIFGYYNDENITRKKGKTFDEFLAYQKSINSKDDTYWRRMYDGVPHLSLPKNESGMGEIKPEEGIFLLNKRKMEELAKENKTSVFQVIMFMVYMAVAKITDENDIILRYTISNRDNPLYRYTLGLLAGAVYTRMVLEDDKTLEEMQREMRKRVGESIQNRYALKDELLIPVAYAVTYLEQGDLNLKPMLNGEPVKVKYIGMQPEQDCIVVNISPLDEDFEIRLCTDYTVYGQHAIKLKEAIQLAETFLEDYPMRRFFDYLRRDITLDTINLLNEKDDIKLIEI